MGAVYAAEGTSGEGEIAIKILHREFVNEEQVVSRFYAEAEASKRLNHPNIARVYDSGTAESGEPFLIMELLRGQPLADACPEGTKMPVQQACVFIKEILVALEEAHRMEIVHRDLKPDNIFLCNVGDRQIAKLLDFGIARVIDAASGGAMRKTKTGMLLGTPGYMSPEQLRNSKTVDPRGDLWSLCTVFYELLSGRDPYGATSDFARLTAVFTQDAILIDRDAPELAPWREFFQRAFQRDINLRFQSAAEMSQAIDAVLSGRPLPALQPVVVVAPQANSVDPIALASTLPASFTVPASFTTPQGHAPASPIVAATVVSAVAPPPAQSAAQPAAQPAPGTSKLVWGLIFAVLVLGAIVVGLAIQSLQDGDKESKPAPTVTPTATVAPHSPPIKKKLP